MSPAPGIRSARSVLVSRHSAFPFIWNRSISNLGRSNSRSHQRRNTPTSSRPHKRGSVGNWAGSCVLRSLRGVVEAYGVRQRRSLPQRNGDGAARLGSGGIGRSFIVDVWLGSRRGKKENRLEKWSLKDKRSMSYFYDFYVWSKIENLIEFSNQMKWDEN